eukprot:3765859-Prymnesium_polylepis.1
MGGEVTRWRGRAPLCAARGGGSHPLNAEAEARVRALLDVVGLVAEPIVDEAGEQAHPHLQHRLLVRPERRAGDAPASAEEDRQLVRPRRADAAAHLCGGALCDRAERLHARRPALLAQAGRLLRGEQAHHEHLEQPVGVVVAWRAGRPQSAVVGACKEVAVRA